jgi:hypothetical protein
LARAAAEGRCYLGQLQPPLPVLQEAQKQFVVPPPLHTQAQPSFVWAVQGHVSDLLPQCEQAQLAQTALHPHFSEAAFCWAAACSADGPVWQPATTKARVTAARSILMAHPHSRWIRIRTLEV